MYKGQCECGNIVYYTISDFRKNTSCGCYRKSRARTDKMMKSMQSFENTLLKSLTRQINSNNTSGYKGVSYSKSKKKWVAYIKLQYKNKYLGTFDTKEAAIQARKEGEEKYYKPIIERYNKCGKNE